MQSDPKVVAIGECGLDYHYDKDEAKHALQKEVFVAQMKMAAELKKPLIVHTREAEEDTLALMLEHLPRSVFPKVFQNVFPKVFPKVTRLTTIP
eukprot:4460636-Pyramimonas_sp.AAC.1